MVLPSIAGSAAAQQWNIFRSGMKLAGYTEALIGLRFTPDDESEPAGGYAQSTGRLFLTFG